MTVDEMTPKDLQASLEKGKTATAELGQLSLTLGYVEFAGGYAFRLDYQDGGSQVVGATTLGEVYQWMEQYAPLGAWSLGD